MVPSDARSSRADVARVHFVVHNEWSMLLAGSCSLIGLSLLEPDPDSMSPDGMSIVRTTRVVA